MTLTLSLIPQFPISAAASDPVTNIKIGEYLQMGTYNGKPILWRCIGYDDYGDPLMFSDKILTIKPFDAASTDKTKGSHARDVSSQREYYGSNYWADSNIRAWLQSGADTVNWHGNPPTADKLAYYTGSEWQGEDKNTGHDGYNAYDQEPGFLSGFSLAERRAIKEVEHDSLLSTADKDLDSAHTNLFQTNDQSHGNWTMDTVLSPSGSIGSGYTAKYDEAKKETVKDTMFLLDIQEIHDLVWANEQGRGTSTFETNYYRGKVTQEAYDKMDAESKRLWGNSVKNAIAGDDQAAADTLSNGNFWHYWLRSPDAGNACWVRHVYSDGLVHSHWASGGDRGVRPAFFLNLTSLEEIGGKGTKTRPFRIQKEDAYGGAASGAKPPAAKADSELIFKGSNDIELIDDTAAKAYLASLPDSDADGEDGALKLEYKLDRSDTPYSDWSTTIPKATNGADTYLVHWRLVGNSVYNDYQGDPIRVQVHTNGSIAAWDQWQPPKQATKEDGTVIDYTGEEQELVTKGNVPKGAQLQYSLNSGTGYTTNIPKATEAGPYTVYYRALGKTSGYDDYENSIQVEIKKCQVSGVTAPKAKQGLVYTGQPQDLIELGSVNDKHGASIAQLQYWTTTNGTDSLTGASAQSLTSPQATDAGTYHVWYAVTTSDANHESWTKAQYEGEEEAAGETKVRCVEVTIEAASPKATVTGRSDLVYNGQDQQLLQQADVDVEGVKLQFSVDDNTHYSDSMPVAKSAGQHTVYYKADAVDKKFNAIAEDSVTVNIAKADADVSAGDKTITYGDELVIEASVKRSGASLSAAQVQPAQDKLKLYVDNGGGDYTLLGTTEGVDVQYTSSSDKDSGTATVTLQKNDYKDKLKPGENKVVAVYGGSVNLNNGGDDEIKVILNKKTVNFSVTAQDKAYADVSQDRPNPSNVVTATLTPSPGDVVDGDTISLAATARTESADVDTYSKVNLSNIRVLPSGDGQYYTVAQTSQDEVSLTQAIKITPVSPEKWIKAPTRKTMKFTSSPQELVTAGSAPSGCTMQYSDNGSTFQTNIPTASSIGSHQVWWRVVADENTRGNKNYTDYPEGLVYPQISSEITDKESPSVTQPKAKSDLTYQKGVQQELIDKGSAMGGAAALTMKYSLNASGPWSEDVPKAENAGTYTVWYMVEGNDDYNGQDPQSVEATIKKAKPVITQDPTPADDLTYSGDQIILIKPGEVTGGTLQYALNSDDDALYTPYIALIVGTRVGSYTVYWRVKGDANYDDYKPENNSLTVSITSAQLTPPTAKQDLVYSGDAQDLINIGTVGGTGKFEYRFYYQGQSDQISSWSETVPQGTNAGMYTVEWKVTGDDHYTDNTGSFSVTIDKANWNVTSAPVGLNLKADGAEQELVKAGVSDGEFKYAVDSNSPESFSTEIPKASAVNTYTIYYMIDGDDNHNQYGVYQVTAHINADTGKQSLEVEPPTPVQGLVYTGSEQTLIEPGSATGNGKSYTMYYSLTNNGVDWSASLPKGTDADTYTVWYKVDGDDEFDNYEPLSITAAIEKAETEFTPPRATTEQVYQNSDVALLVPGRITKGDGHFEYSLTKDDGYSETVPTKNTAGAYTVWYKITGSGPNYKDTEPVSIEVTLTETLVPPPVKTTVKKTAAGYVFEDLLLENAQNGDTVITALYNGNALVAVQFNRLADVASDSVTMSGDVTADNAKVFIWESVNSMVPRGAASVIDTITQ